MSCCCCHSNEPKPEPQPKYTICVGGKEDRQYINTIHTDVIPRVGERVRIASTYYRVIDVEYDYYNYHRTLDAVRLIVEKDGEQ